jgi:hypothetical protein
MFNLPGDVFDDRPSTRPGAGSTSIHGVTVNQNIQAYNTGGASMLSSRAQELKVNPQHQINSCIVWTQSSCCSTIQLLDALTSLHWTHSLTHSAVPSARRPTAIAWRSLQNYIFRCKKPLAGRLCEIEPPISRLRYTHQSHIPLNIALTHCLA